MSTGKIYGVGAGPGAPDLITLRALAVIRRVPVVVFPRSSDHGASMAWNIVAPSIERRPDQERLQLTFPMSRDPSRVGLAWEHAFAVLGAYLERGLDVAFVTEGDPSLYSTFVYLREEAPRRWPGIEIEVVPGVSSIAAVPAVSGLSLADGEERIAIVPAAYGVEDLGSLLQSFDTVILMKIGPEMPRIIDGLTTAGLLDRAVYVSRATMQDQRIVRDLSTLAAERGDCFTMVVVARRERSGVLLRTAAREEARP